MCVYKMVLYIKVQRTTEIEITVKQTLEIWYKTDYIIQCPRFLMIYMLFTGREVRIGKNCARGLEYGPRPYAEGRTRDRGHSFSQYGPTKAGE